MTVDWKIDTMFYPFLENTTKTIRYALLWLGYGFLQTFALYPVCALPFGILLLDGLVHALIFAVLGLLLWSVVKYGNFSILSVYQRYVNYFAMALLTLAIWLGVGYGLFYLMFGDKLAAQLAPLLPVRGLVGLLIYSLIVQHFCFLSVQPAELEPALDPEVDTRVDLMPESAVPVDLLERIAVKSGNRIHVVLVQDIVYLQADGDYVQIFTADGKFLKEQTMKYFEQNLPGHQFVRVHRSAIVNVAMISRIELYEKQNQLLTLKNGHQVKTSPGGYKALRVVLNL